METIDKSWLGKEMLQRRDMLKRMALLGGGIVLPFMLPACKEDTSPPEAFGNFNNEYYKYKLGSFTVYVISDGMTASLPPSFLAVNAPEELLNAELQANNLPSTGIALPALCMLVDTGSNLVLIDTGFGKYRFADQTAESAGKLVSRLGKIGIKPTEIDTVLISHALADHIGGVINGQGTLNFPNARHIISRVEWDFWQGVINASIPDNPNQAAVDIAHETLTAITPKLVLTEGNEEVVPGIQLLNAFGHTPGHLAFEIYSGTDRLLHTMEAALHQVLSLEHPDWFTFFDVDPVMAVQTKRAIFDRAADENLLSFGYHFPYPGLGRVARVASGNHWRWLPSD